MQEGKVEILHDHVWKAIYAESMDFNLATLLCRMLDYHTAKSYHEREVVQPRDGIVNGFFQCTGEELHFNDCDFANGGINNTGDRSRVATLSCISSKYIVYLYDNCNSYMTKIPLKYQCMHLSWVT